MNTGICAQQSGWFTKVTGSDGPIPNFIDFNSYKIHSKLLLGKLQVCICVLYQERAR